LKSNGRGSCAAYGAGGEQGKEMAETKTGPSEAMLMLYEHALAEVLEASRELAQLVAKLKRVKRGSEAYYDLTAKIAVATTIIRAKAESAEHIDEELTDAMPDD
jgi:hypothetical protein